jgi:hypothetical protein
MSPTHSLTLDRQIIELERRVTTLLDNETT